MPNTIKDEFKAQVMKILNEEVGCPYDDVEGLDVAADRIVSEIIMLLVNVG